MPSLIVPASNVTNWIAEGSDKNAVFEGTSNLHTESVGHGTIKSSYSVTAQGQPYYIIHQWGLVFDVSALPLGATITGAVLGYTATTAPDYGIVLEGSTVDSSGRARWRPRSSAESYYLGSQPAQQNIPGTLGISASDLNLAGSGAQKAFAMCLMSWYSNTAPSGVQEMQFVNAGGAGPTLTVNYTASLPTGAVRMVV